MCSGWMDKVYKYKRLLCNHNKEGNPFICDNMDGPWGIILSEVSQTENDKYCVISLICGIWKNQFIETW